MIARKNCVWLVGWFAVGRIDGLSVVGFIASRLDGWFVLVCLQVAGQVWDVSHLASQGEIPSSPIPG